MTKAVGDSVYVHADDVLVLLALSVAVGVGMLGVGGPPGLRWLRSVVAST